MHERRIAYFRNFGEVEAVASGSPVYRALCRAVVESPTLLELAAETRHGQPEANLLFAAVHYLLESHPGHALAAYYRSLGGTKDVDGSAGPAFEHFCSEYQAEIAELLHERLVQTNEVRRSACLLPAFIEASRDAGGLPLSLIEIGPSAGLNLMFDRYGYDYGGRVRAGDTGSPVQLACDLRAGTLPGAGAAPPIVSRQGIDLNPLDVRNENDVRWLRALVWPEHDDRRALLAAAVGVVQTDPPELLGGDVFELLPRLVRDAPAGSAVCVVATFVLNQFTEEMRTRLREQLLALSFERHLWLVVMGYSTFTGIAAAVAGDVHMVLVRSRAGVGEARVIADANPHGRWMKLREWEEWKPWVPLPATAASP